MSALATRTDRHVVAGAPSPNPAAMPRVLSDADKRRFVEHGYLVRRLEFDPELYTRAIDLARQHLDPQPRRQPHTWRGGGAMTVSCRTRPEPEWRDDVGRRECVPPMRWLSAVVHADPRIFEMVRDLVGPDAVPRLTIRGLHPLSPPSALEAHHQGRMASHPFQVSCILYLNDVERDGGEFVVWPGSHRIMSRAFDGPYSWRFNSQRCALHQQAEAKCGPEHLTGPAGTVILWHHRLLHGPNSNLGFGTLHALVGDFLRTDWEERVGETYAAGMWSGWAVDDRHLAWHRRLGAFARRLLAAGATNGPG